MKMIEMNEENFLISSTSTTNHHHQFQNGFNCLQSSFLYERRSSTSSISSSGQSFSDPSNNKISHKLSNQPATTFADCIQSFAKSREKIGSKDKNRFQIDSDSNDIKLPYYFCTVTCCESQNCSLIDQKSSLIPLDAMDQYEHLYHPHPQNCGLDQSHSAIFVANLDEPSESPRQDNNDGYTCVCFNHKLNDNLIGDNRGNDGENEETKSSNLSSVKSDDPNSLNQLFVRTKSRAKFPLKNSLLIPSFNRENPQQQPQQHHFDQHSPENSSSPYGNNSSNTELTEIFTPTPPILMNSAATNISNSNVLTPSTATYSIIQPLFRINSSSEDASKHGFFRKAVPTLPLAIAIMFCVMNLILPGSGTFLASIAIVLGSPTEYETIDSREDNFNDLDHRDDHYRSEHYEPIRNGCSYQAFLICFLSSILQFLTAIFVFGWVWSIMWGIVFIKSKQN
ncbi:Exocyst complex component 6B [Sarcoptes scabiei]|nr:Exocyst complex component 6B [Sarcoptes scabiei]